MKFFMALFFFKNVCGNSSAHIRKKLDIDGSLDDSSIEEAQNGPIADVGFGVKRPIFWSSNQPQP